MVKKVLICIAMSLLIAFFVFESIQAGSRRREWESTRKVETIIIDKGDTLNEIGYQYKPEWLDVREYTHAIKELNNMENSDIKEGQELKVYICTKQYTADGLALNNGTLITVDGHEWSYDTTLKGCVKIIFNDNGTEDITDDIIINVERR